MTRTTMWLLCHDVSLVGKRRRREKKKTVFNCSFSEGIAFFFFPL